MKTIGEFIKEKRILGGLSLREASGLSGVSHTHIRDIEKGSSVPSFEMVMTFLRTYSIEIGEFLRETGHLSPDMEQEQTGKIKRVPILSWTQAGQWRECANSQQYDCDTIETDSRGTFALSVRGDSMESRTKIENHRSSTEESSSETYMLPGNIGPKKRR